MPTQPDTTKYFNSFFEDLNEKVHNLGSDTLKIALTNSAPVATNTLRGNITQIANGNGYTTGGTAVNITASSQTSGVYTLVGDDVEFTSSGAGMATFRYAVLYNDTSTNDRLISWVDYGAGISLDAGEKFKIKYSVNSGIILRVQAEA
jgi:hypothetical protein